MDWGKRIRLYLCLVVMLGVLLAGVGGLFVPPRHDYDKEVKLGNDVYRISEYPLRIDRVRNVNPLRELESETDVPLLTPVPPGIAFP